METINLTEIGARVRARRKGLGWTQEHLAERMDVSSQMISCLERGVKSIQIDGVDATEENITAGTYALQRPFVMATNGEISEQSELVQAFFEFVYSEQGQEVVSQVGLITVDGPSAE